MPEAQRTSIEEYDYDDPRRAEVDTLLDVVRRLQVERDALRQQLADLRRERRVATTGGMER